MNPAVVIGWTLASWQIAASLGAVWLLALTPVELCPPASK